MEDYEPLEQSPAFEDRKTWLIVFGILLIVLGGIFALMAPLALVVVLLLVPEPTLADCSCDRS